MKNTTIWEDSELRWSIDEITCPEQAKKAKRLMRLVNSKRPFDIGWVGLKKEIVSFNIRREKRGGEIELSVCASMDELPYDLITDADENMTCDEIDKLMEDDEYSFRIGEVETDVTETETLRNEVTLKEISDVFMRLWNRAKKRLDHGFGIVKEVVSDYLKNKNA